MKSYLHTSHSLLVTALVGSCLAFIFTSPLHAQKAKPAVDPATHAAHVAAGTIPADPAPDNAKGDPALAQQISQLMAKVTQLEATLAKGAPPAAAMPGMAGMTPGPAMATDTPMTGMGGGAAPAAGGMNGMMGMMDKMMGMMDKMMSMGGDAMPAAAPMAAGAMPMMDDDMMEMAPMGGGSAMPAAPMAGGGMGMMGMDKMEMAGMMGMGGGSMAAMPQSALPGFPGASHLYHLGATGFFLDHKTHIALTTEQTAALNQAKEKAALAKSTADRAIEQAEQELWTLTAADQPDIAAIEAKTAEIGKLSGAVRVAFIRAIGEASKILTDVQRKILTGFAPPAPAMPAPAAPAAMAPMKDM